MQKRKLQGKINLKQKTDRYFDNSQLDKNMCIRNYFQSFNTNNKPTHNLTRNWRDLYRIKYFSTSLHSFPKFVQTFTSNETLCCINLDKQEVLVMKVNIIEHGETVRRSKGIILKLCTIYQARILNSFMRLKSGTISSYGCVWCSKMWIIALPAV